MDALRIGCNQPLPPLIEQRGGEPAGFEPISPACSARHRDALDAVLAAVIASGELALLWQRHVGGPIPDDVIGSRARETR